MKKRTILSLVLALVMLLSLAACAKVTTNVEKPDDSVSVSQEATVGTQPTDDPAYTEAVKEAESEGVDELDVSAVIAKAEFGEPTASKTIVVTIKYDEVVAEYTIHTDAENLQDALTGVEGLVAGNDSEYGLFITKVLGRTADDAKQEWWCITKGGETLFTGAKDTVIADGDVYELTLTVGW